MRRHGAADDLAPSLRRPRRFQRDALRARSAVEPPRLRRLRARVAGGRICVCHFAADHSSRSLCSVAVCADARGRLRAVQRDARAVRTHLPLAARAAPCERARGAAVRRAARDFTRRRARQPRRGSRTVGKTRARRLGAAAAAEDVKRRWHVGQGHGGGRLVPLALLGRKPRLETQAREARDDHAESKASSVLRGREVRAHHRGRQHRDALGRRGHAPWPARPRRRSAALGKHA
mmetsp:Transcript_34112/g.74888  ORF Transcript_34112/g.74888 Transcript_34112/m.74888 type:complete len:234 (-) Transcript_34112:1025-1726(-)